MRPYLFICLICFIITGVCLLSSCDAIIEPSIAKKTVQPEAPADQYQSTSYTVGFWKHQSICLKDRMSRWDDKK